MLQVILFVILLGIGLILRKRKRNLLFFFKGLNDVIMKIIDIIMLFSPFGVFSLMALMVEILTLVRYEL
jgi:Na+/H+-dicarboxylate symporter